MAAGGIAQGYLDAVNQGQNRAYMGAITNQLALKAQAMQRQQAARQALGPLLFGMDFQQQPPLLPPPPGMAPRGPMPPGVGVPSMPMGPQAGPLPAPPMAGPPGGAPGPAPAPMPAPIPPYQALPQMQPEPEAGEIPAPPGAEPAMPGAPAPTGAPAAAAPAAPAAAPGRAFNLPNIIKSMKEQGIPQEQVMDMLDELAPVMNAQNQQELNLYKAHLTAAQKAESLYLQTIRELTRSRDVDLRARDREERNRIARAKINASVGGADNVRRSVPVFDEEGTQTGWNILTKGGQSLQFDMDGKPRTGPAGPGPRAPVNKAREVNALRGELATLSNLELTSPNPDRKKRMNAIEKRLRELGEAVKPVAGATPDASIQPKAVAAWGTYEPGKYEYRINEQGQVQRKLKGQ